MKKTLNRICYTALSTALCGLWVYEVLKLLTLAVGYR